MDSARALPDGQGLHVTMTWMNVQMPPFVAARLTAGVTTPQGCMNAAASGHTFLTIINVWKVSWDYPCDKNFPSLYFDVVYCRPLSCCFKLQMNVS